MRIEPEPTHPCAYPPPAYSGSWTCAGTCIASTSDGQYVPPCIGGKGTKVNLWGGARAGDLAPAYFHRPSNLCPATLGIAVAQVILHRAQVDGLVGRVAGEEDDVRTGAGSITTAKLIGLGVGTVQRLKREMGGHAAN